MNMLELSRKGVYIGCWISVVLVIWTTICDEPLFIFACFFFSVILILWTVLCC